VSVEPPPDASPAFPEDAESRRLRFELAIDAAGIGSFDYDLVTGRLRWDDRLVELFGYDRSEFTETIEAFFARLHPEDVDRTAEGMQAAVDGRGELDVEYRVVLPGGETRWVQGRGRALVDSSGRAVRLIGAAHDTTRQRHGDARVARVLEAMSAAFFSLDRNWRFDYVNAEAERVLHKSRQELHGGSIWTLFPAAVGSDFEKHYRGAVQTGEPRTFEAYYPPPLDAWYEVRAYPGPDGLSVYFVEVTERKRAEERARRSAARLGLIADVAEAMTEELGTPGGESAAALRVARAVVPVLGDWAIVSLAEEDGRLRDTVSWHHDPSARRDVARYAELRLAALKTSAPLVLALASGQVMVVPDVWESVGRVLEGEARDVLARIAPRSALAVPLAVRGRTLGALSIYRSADRPIPDDEETATARELAGRIALALDNARLGEQQRRLAEGLQRSLLSAPPVTASMEIAVRYQPAQAVAEVGGDWYDAFVQPDGATMLVIGDVVGHDTAAAAAMGQLRGLLRGVAYRAGAGPVDVLSGLDAAMDGLGVRAMATAAIVRVEDLGNGRTSLRWSNAGHPPPVVLRTDGRVEALAGERAELMLGVDPAVRRSEAEAEVGAGDVVLLYTDGLVEGRDLPYDEGVDRLVTAVAELAGRPLEELCDGLLERVRPGERQDDVALVAVRLR
jgi:serine phosphatase RsbU (regulator of sigma subunit)/PAS domain-containing protein